MPKVNSGRKRPDFGPFPKGEKAKEHRRFESPPLQQQRAARPMCALRAVVAEPMEQLGIVPCELTCDFSVFGG